MKNIAVLTFDFDREAENYASLLREEDFDFRNKKIEIEVKQFDSKVEIALSTNSILEFKIGVSALTKSLEVISKTLAV